MSLVACALAAMSGPALAQVPDSIADEQAIASGIVRPETARRIVRIFDFEEQFTSRGGLPTSWFRAQDDPMIPRERPGFPIYNQAHIDRSVAASGRGSLRLPTQGGSTSLRLETGAMPVFANADYQVNALVRTEDLVRARAQLSAVLLTQTGEPIEASREASPLLLTDGSWQRVAIPIWGDWDDAAYLRIDLELLQPREFMPSELGDRQVWLQDVSGAAWFDDVTVVQLPRIELRTNSPANVVTLPDSPELNLLIRDLTGENLSAKIEVYDDLGRIADSRAIDVGAGRTLEDWAPELERLGWYRAVISVSNDAIEIGRAYVDFVWVPGKSRLTTAVPRWSDPARLAAAESVGELPKRRERGSLDRERFGLVADHLQPTELRSLPDLIRGIGTGSVTIPFWDETVRREEVAELVSTLDPVLDELLEDWQRVTLSLPRTPALLAAELKLTNAQVAEVLADDPELWEPYLLDAMDRFGQRIQRWQIGTISPGSAKPMQPDADLLDTGDRALGRLVPGPVITLPWTPGQAFEAERFETRGLDAALLSWPVEAPGDGLTLAGERWFEMEDALLDRTEVLSRPDPLSPGAGGLTPSVQHGMPELVVMLEPASHMHLGVRRAVAEMVKRAVAYWAAVPSTPSPMHGHRHRIALRQPWTFGGGRRSQIMPGPELAAWRSLIERLSEREVVGELDVGPDATCLILAPRVGAPSDRGGALVAWTDGASGHRVVLEEYLGAEEITAYDMYGQATPVARVLVEDEIITAAARRSTHRVDLQPEPVFIEGVDTELVRFIASLAVDPPFLPASVDEHQRMILLTNPWDVPATGQVVIVDPGGRRRPGLPPDRSWTVGPRMSPFSIPPGGTARLPITVSFNPAQEAGSHDFVFDVYLSANREYGWMRLDTPVEVGLEGLRIELTYRRGPGPGGPDLLLEAQIVNTGAEPVTLELTAFAPGAPRFRATITDLAAGEQELRVFQYQGMADALIGERLSVRAREVNSGARLNKSIVVE
ncbi:MAG: hypothetical protein AAGG07_09945 [Planctomycetota bacterium]